MFYLDTSYLLKSYAQEHGSAEVVAWMTGRSHFVCSHHGRLELISGLKRHQREGRIDGRGLRHMLTQIEADEKNRFLEWLPVTPPHRGRVPDRGETTVSRFSPCR